MPYLSRRLTILCIDDAENALFVRKLVLERAGYIVLTGIDGEQGLKLFRSHNIDRVISDYFLPGRTGAELSHQMKQEKPMVPILLFSGESERPEEAEDADLFISKADGPVQLLEKVAALLQMRRESAA